MESRWRLGLGIFGLVLRVIAPWRDPAGRVLWGHERVRAEGVYFGFRVGAGMFVGVGGGPWCVLFHMKNL